MIPVLMILGLAAAVSLMTTTPEQREAVAGKWIKPLEPWLFAISAAIIALFIFGQRRD